MHAEWQNEREEKSQGESLGTRRFALLGPLVWLAMTLFLFGSFMRSALADETRARNFYDVLEDVMGDFEYDIKNGNVSGLKDVSIRNIATSENIPPSFKTHLDLLVTERIMRNSRARVIQCLPCRSKKTSMNGDQVVITSAETNPVELARIAKMSGIANFMDLAFSYQPNGMVLSMFISEPESGAIVWSRSYNSETSRASAFRRGVDFSQGDDARKLTEYTPTVQYRGTLYYMFEPNIGRTTGCLVAGFRMVERYDNRKKEVGFEINYSMDSSSIVGGNAAGTPNLYSGLNANLLFVHAWNLIGDEENFNKPRGSYYIGIGGTYSSGFLGALIRNGYEWRLGKHYSVSGNLGFRPSSTAYNGAAELGKVSGLEFGIGISMFF